MEIYSVIINNQNCRPKESDVFLVVFVYGILLAIVTLSQNVFMLCGFIALIVLGVAVHANDSTRKRKYKRNGYLKNRYIKRESLENHEPKIYTSPHGGCYLFTVNKPGHPLHRKNLYVGRSGNVYKRRDNHFRRINKGHSRKNQYFHNYCINQGLRTSDLIFTKIDDRNDADVESNLIRKYNTYNDGCNRIR